MNWLIGRERGSLPKPNQTKPMWKEEERKKNKHTHVRAQWFYFVEIFAAVVAAAAAMISLEALSFAGKKTHICSLIFYVQIAYYAEKSKQFFLLYTFFSLSLLFVHTRTSTRIHNRFFLVEWHLEFFLINNQMKSMFIWICLAWSTVNAMDFVGFRKDLFILIDWRC